MVQYKARGIYAKFYCVRNFAYYLRGKEFVLETNRKNLLWMAKSEVPKIIRWNLHAVISFHAQTYQRQRQRSRRCSIISPTTLEVIWDEEMKVVKVDTVLCSLIVLEDSNYESTDQYLHAVFGQQSLRVREHKPKLPEAMTER